jgi:hypothetical protein
MDLHVGEVANDMLQDLAHYFQNRNRFANHA